MFEPMLRNATIKAIDGVSKKLSRTEAEAETAVTRMLAHWNAMDTAEKEHIAGIVIATATTAATAIIALRRRVKSPVKTASKQLVKAAAKKIRK